MGGTTLEEIKKDLVEKYGITAMEGKLGYYYHISPAFFIHPQAYLCDMYRRDARVREGIGFFCFDRESQARSWVRSLCAVSRSKGRTIYEEPVRPLYMYAYKFNNMGKDWADVWETKDRETLYERFTGLQLLSASALRKTPSFVSYIQKDWDLLTKIYVYLYEACLKETSGQVYTSSIFNKDHRNFTYENLQDIAFSTFVHVFKDDGELPDTAKGGFLGHLLYQLFEDICDIPIVCNALVKSGITHFTQPGEGYSVNPEHKIFDEDVADHLLRYNSLDTEAVYSKSITIFDVNNLELVRCWQIFSSTGVNSFEVTESVIARAQQFDEIPDIPEFPEYEPTSYMGQKYLRCTNRKDIQNKIDKRVDVCEQNRKLYNTAIAKGEHIESWYKQELLASIDDTSFDLQRQLDDDSSLI